MRDNEKRKRTASSAKSIQLLEEPRENIGEILKLSYPNEKEKVRIYIRLPRVFSSLDTARFIAPKDASHAKSRSSQVSWSNTPSAQISFQNAVNCVV
jgi:hypothetical protein